MEEEIFYERIRNILTAREIHWIEKKMMGGITFMIDEKMCFGSFKGGLLCRIDPEERAPLLAKEGIERMFQGGREMKGYVLVPSEKYESDFELEFWISKCLEFNPKAKSSKKKKRK